MKRGHHRLKGRFFGLGVDVNRDAAAVIGDLDSISRQKPHLDILGKTGQRLIQAVINTLPNQMVEALGTGRADVHAGTAPHRLQSFQNINIFRLITWNGIFRHLRRDTVRLFFNFPSHW